MMLLPQAPVTESKFRDRDVYQLGSLSHFLNARATGYQGGSLSVVVTIILRTDALLRERIDIDKKAKLITWKGHRDVKIDPRTCPSSRRRRPTPRCGT